MGNDHPGSRGRTRAIALKAADARTLLQSLPIVLQHMTPAQIGQVQMVLDAAVVNPAVQAEYAAMKNKAVYETAGGRSILNQRLYDQADKLFQEQIVVGDSDKRIKLDPGKLLAPDALKPITDNPDEAAYLDRVRNTLAIKGVWLRIGQPFVGGPAGMRDSRPFAAWLSLGPGGGAIPTTNGQLTREVLLGTTVLGAGYYAQVYQGGIETALKRALNAVSDQISEGEGLHHDWERHRDAAAPLVVPISDALGGAGGFPSTKIWDAPHELVVQALKLNINGNVKDSSQLAIYAAILTESANRVLHQYIEDTTAGAQRAVRILNYIKTAGKIAEMFLVVRALVGGMVRLLAADAAAAETGAVATRKALPPGKNHAPEAYYPTNYQSPPGARFRPEFEKTLNVANRTPVTGGGIGTAIDRFGLATQQKINGWHDEFARRVKDLMAAKGHTGGGWVVSSDEMAALDKAVSAKWGDIFSLYQ